VADTLYVNIPGDTMTGPLVLPADPVNPLEAATKQYVDTLTAGKVPVTRFIGTSAPLIGGGPLTGNLQLEINDFTPTTRGTVPMSGGGTTNFLRADGNWVAVLTQTQADTMYVKIPGDTMTGTLALPTLSGVETNPINFITNGIRRMQIRGTAGTTGAVDIGDPTTTGNNSSFPLTLYGNINANQMLFMSAATELGRFGFATATAMRASTTQTGSGFEVMSDSIDFYTGTPAARTLMGEFKERVRIFGQAGLVGGIFRMVRDDSATYNYIEWYDQAETQRQGWIGDRAGVMYVTSQVNHIMNVAASGIITFSTGTTYPPPAANEWARFDASGNFLIGKQTAGIANTGTHIISAGTTPGGNVGITNDTPNTPMLICNKTVIGAGHDYIHFRNTNTTIGSITRNASTAAVLYNTSSDYRLKHDHGGIQDGLLRLMRLLPRRIVWKDDPDQTEMDGFFAHEVAEVVPDAVTGDKDAVADDDDEDRGMVAGQIIAQQLDVSRLVPLLVAAVQDLARRVEGAT